MSGADRHHRESIAGTQQRQTGELRVGVGPQFIERDDAREAPHELHVDPKTAEIISDRLDD